jgi:hypothetical protein
MEIYLIILKKCIKEDKIDFVMGTAGATGWDTFFMGTNTGLISGIDVPMFYPYRSQIQEN